MAAFKRNRPTIGVLVGWQVFTWTIDTFLEHVIRGIQAAAEAHNCNLLLACGTSTAIAFNENKPGWPVADARVDFLPVGPWNCDGIIIIPPIAVKTCEQFAVDLTASGYPVIFAGLQGLGPGVGVDNAMGIRQAVQHLYEHGHRRIAFLAGYDFDIKGDSGSRLEAYRQALAECSLSYDPDLVAYGYHNTERGQQAMRQVLARRADFSAVLASNDLTAIGAMAALEQAGYRIPQDVAVIGFDNRIETRAQTPPLTTIHFPMFELGYQSLAMILDRLEGRVAPQELRLIPTQLVVRESCGCLPGETGKLNVQASRVGLPEVQGIKEEIAAIIQTETHRMPRRDAIRLTERCVEAFCESVVSGKPQVFLGAFQEVLERVSACQNDLFTWQYAITVLRNSPNPVVEPRLNREEVDQMLDRARVMVSETAKAQATRQLIRQAQVSEQLVIMTNRFFEAQDENAVFEILNQSLPLIGIDQNAVFYYKPQGDDPFAFSSLQSPHAVFEKGCLLNTYQFPPPELFGEEEPLHCALLPLGVDKELTGYMALRIGPLEPLADIVRQLASSLYAVRLRQEAIHGQRMAEEANHLKSRFLSMVSHELRAPLNLITGLSDIILKNKNNAAMADFSWDDLERIYTSSQHLDGLIQDVLDLALSDVGQLKLACEPLNLKEVLDSVALICTSLIQDKGLAWRYEVADSLPRVWGDRTRIRQITLNLLNNAIKFTEHGEVALRAAIDPQGKVAVTVSDTGLGIPPGEQEIIFQEFRQSERTASRGYGGLGLGLAICKRLVELHGGEISVYSSGRPNQGAAFTFTLLPIADPPAAVPRSAGEELASRVLLLVKGAGDGAVLRQYLTEKGHQVSVYPLGGEWLAQVLMCDPDVVILDREVTAERGWEILRALKEVPATREIPVLFYSVSSDGQSGSFLELEYLSKPVKSAVLGEMLLHYHVTESADAREAPPMILVVDDDIHTVELHRRIILSQFPNVCVRPAYNGRQALEMIHQQPPALVLLDLLMPEMDGFAVLTEMRAHPPSRDVPVIVITSQSLSCDDIARLNQGMVSILGKNLFTQDETLQHIAKFLQKRARRSPEAQNAILKAMAFIHANYKEPISRRDIAVNVGLSERHLDRCFQQGLGISPITYLNRYRVQQARNLLETRKIGITAVAMEVGFSSSGYFARVFKDEVGISPRDYLLSKHPNA